MADKAARLADEMKGRNPTQEAWTILQCLEDAVRTRELPRGRIGAIRRVLKTCGVD
ncbi:MAG: hypothetical protein IH855_08240 [Bacteroidetes bacterium]|nr:hypothetical protein [Bacteroidota bacterium]